MSITYLRSAATLAAICLLTVTATPAQAATRTVRRGVDGCIAWSWDDDNVLGATVYLHNRCDEARVARIAWRSAAVALTSATLAPDAKDHFFRPSDPRSIWDAGRP
jgi:hypothetical protein